MTVEELRNRLSKFDGKAHVVVCWEREEEMHLLEIDGVEMHRGTPSRNKDGEQAFAFDGKGPVNWLFVSVSQD